MAACTCHKIASNFDGIIKDIGRYPFDRIHTAFE